MCRVNDHLADTATFPSLIPKVFPAGFERESDRGGMHTQRVKALQKKKR